MPADKPVGTDSYKGVRDFYPEDMLRFNYLMRVMRETAESFGYREVNASVLEPSALYDAKSGDELAREQSYRFEDRGGRDVMLRPEMTPTVARMIAAKEKALARPIRWYSIPNLFRYEAPQQGRLREHWQFNVDIFGVSSQWAQIEIITVAHQLLKNLGAEDDDFVIKLNSRNLFSALCNDVLAIDNETALELAKLMDKREKLDSDAFYSQAGELLDEKARERLSDYLSAGDLAIIEDEFGDTLSKEIAELKQLITSLEDNGVGNTLFAPGLVRGLDYYTGVVFEVFDTSPENNRSLLGGGRYDNLMEIFDTKQIPAVGFGLGDVTLADFMSAHDLWPQLESRLDVSICLLDNKTHGQFGYQVANELRGNDFNTVVDISATSLSTQLKHADQAGARYAVIVGDDEVANDTATVKNLETGDETEVERDRLVEFIQEDGK